MNKYLFIIYILSFSSFLFANENFHNESLEDLMNLESEAKVDIGSRDGAKNYLDAKAAVDVITAEQIEHTGYSSLTDVLRYFVAGFNAPEPSVSDGSDHVRAFTLRGMSPDQVLVLINGKRLHTSALLHVNASIGRGSSGVDLDTIPVDAIQRVEILRDGAAAQYGSDAIAGVINIVLKGSGHKNKIILQSGEHPKGEGKKNLFSGFISIPLKYDGFVNFTMDAIKADKTQNAGVDRRLTPAVVKTHYGLPDATNYHFLMNAELPQENGSLFYSTILIAQRDSQASAFFRTPDVSRAIYPNGFLPIIHAHIIDYSATVGMKGEIFNGIQWDISQVIGQNSFSFHVTDSMNYDLNNTSPTSFNNGELVFSQDTTNLDLKKQINEMLTLALGAEYRVEKYSIHAGDVASYINGGSQGFAGFQPDNETNNKRDNYAFYTDATFDFTPKLSTELAGRYEKYSDFGTTSNIKLAGTYKVSDALRLRTSVSTGFRAPSLAQSNYSLTSTYLDGNSTITTQGTFKTTDPNAIANGAKALKPEKSQHLSLGAVYKRKNYYFMADYFYTNIDDKIMLSANIPVNIGNITGMRFFTNAIDTKTEGIDIKGVYNYKIDESRKLDISLWYNYSINKVTQINTPYVTRANSLAAIDAIENGQPKNSQRLLLNYQTTKYNIAYNLSRFGSYSQVASGTSIKFDPVIISDLELSYQITKRATLSVGGNNVFNTRPNKWKNLSGIGYGYDGILPYSNYSPIGFSGAFYYVKTSIRF